MSVRLFIGWPGFGKSLAMQDICAQAVEAGHLCFTVDRCYEWAADSKDKEGRSRWRDSPPLISEAPQEIEDDEELYSELCRLRDDEKGWLVRFGFPWDGFQVGELARKVGSVIVADDECDYTTSRGSWEQMHKPDSPLRGFSVNPFRDFVHRGRHLPSPVDYVPREVHLLGAMRRPENVHTDLTSVAEEVMLFRIGGHTTLERLTKEGWLTDEQLTEVQRLPPLHYLLHKKGEGTEAGVLKGL